MLIFWCGPVVTLAITLLIKFGVVVNDIANGAVGLGFDFLTDQIENYRQRLAVAVPFLYCPGAKRRRWAPSLVACFHVIRLVLRRFVFFLEPINFVNSINLTALMVEKWQCIQ